MLRNGLGNGFRGRYRGFHIGIYLLTIAVLSGCAFGTRQANLIYPPAPEAGAAIPAAQAQPPARKASSIYVANFRDERTDKSTVGTVRNGFGMRTADVVPTGSVSDWVTQGMTRELRASGYTVVTKPAGDAVDPGAYLVSGDVLNVFCDMYMSYTGQVSLLVKASLDGTEVMTKHYAGEGSAGIAWAATGESYAQSLALALRDALRKFIAELDARVAAR